MRMIRQHEEEAVEAIADEATALVECCFGGEGVEEAESISRQMFQKAQHKGRLIPARSLEFGSPASCGVARGGFRSSRQ